MLKGQKTLKVDKLDYENYEESEVLKKIQISDSTPKLAKMFQEEPEEPPIFEQGAEEPLEEASTNESEDYIDVESTDFNEKEENINMEKPHSIKNQKTIQNVEGQDIKKNNHEIYIDMFVDVVKYTVEKPIVKDKPKNEEKPNVVDKPEKKE